MTALRRWCSDRPVLAFYLLALALSWAYWLTMLANGQVSGPGSAVSHLPGLLGPMLSAIAVTALVSGLPGLRELTASALVLRRPRWRNAALALSPLAIGYLVFQIFAFTGVPFPSWADFRSYPGLPSGWPLGLVFFAALMLNGYGEELGWRGFALQELVPRHGKLKATWIVAGLWLVWHAPLFWVTVNMHALLGPVFFGWAFGLVCGAFVLAGLYLSSGQSVLVVAVWHTLYNFVVATPAGAGTPAAIISTLVMVWGAYFAFAWWRQGRAERST